MNKFEIIEEINRLNTTASIEFLSQFSDGELTEYLEHLKAVRHEDLTAMVPTCVPFN
ncbi:MAG: hypothetical protein K9M57_02665 [Phycisphaerae bacterium]|nr:hypothetical protein [Phycisphaerae bacterium]